MTSVQEWADHYASLGLPVFPTLGKRPIPGISFLNATTKPSIIRAWWSSKISVDWGVGIAIPKWLTIVDIESTEGFNVLSALDCPLPATIVSGARGRHYWYKTEMDTSAYNRIKPLPEVDFLSNGGLVVPPSPHPEGFQYKWETPFNLDAIAEAPEWVYTLISQHNRESSSRVNLDEMLDGVAEGQRQVSLFRLACWLRSKNRTITEAMIIVKEIAKKSGYTEQDPARLVERVFGRYEPGKQNANVLNTPKVWSIKDLVEQRQGIVPMVVDKLVPFSGLTMVVSDPKVGKSALVAQIAQAIASNTPLWGRYNVTTCGVLYMDLEQSEVPAANRWAKYAKGNGIPDHLYTVFEWPRMDKGGLEQLREFLYSNSHVRVVVLDTLADFKPEDLGPGNVYYSESNLLLEIKNFAKELDIAIIVVHHHSKSAGDKADADFMKKGSGSQAIGGKADAFFSLDRPLTQRIGKLLVGGKNIPTSSLMLDYNREDTQWAYLGAKEF